MTRDDSTSEPKVELQPSRNGSLESARDIGFPESAAIKLLTGDSLADVLATRPSPAHDRARFLKLFEELCRVLAFMHGEQVVHGLLSPHLVKLDALGRVHVVGWGKVSSNGIEAQPRDGPPGGARVDSPAYLSPELAREEWSKVSTRTDVFALGAILFVILTGRPPYEGKITADILQKAGNAQLGDALSLLEASKVDTSLVLLVSRCLNAEPAERPADAVELLRLVSAYREVLDERARKVEAEALATAAVEAERGKRKQVQLALVLVVGLFVIWGCVFIWWQERQNRTRNTPVANPEPVAKRPEVDPVIAQQKAREVQERLKQRRQQYEKTKDEIIKRLKNPPAPPMEELLIPVAPHPREPGQPPPPVPDPDPE